MTDRDQNAQPCDRCKRLLAAGLIAGALSQEQEIAALRAERDALIAERSKLCALADNAASERDAALARVKEVEGEEWYQRMTARAEGAESALCQSDQYNTHLEDERDQLKADNERLRGLLADGLSIVRLRVPYTKSASWEDVGNFIMRADGELSR